MRTWRIACIAAVLAIGLATAAHADEWNKLTYLTFSGPVTMPGITLPAGTYRFELMDPDSSRRVIRVSDKEGTKNYGIFLSISDQKLKPSDNPVVMFKEMPAGSPQAIEAWFYPGETTGYEFVYPHDQALKIARATRQAVLSMKEAKESTTEADRVAAMRGAEVGRIDENEKVISTNERLKESSSLYPSNQTAATTTAAATEPSTPPAATTTAPSSSTTASSSSVTTTAPEPTTAPKVVTPEATTVPEPTTAAPTTATDQTAAPTTVGTSGTTTTRHLPGTASPVPLMALLSSLSLAGALGVRTARKSIG